MTAEPHIAWNEPLRGMVGRRAWRALTVTGLVRPRFWVLYVVEPAILYALIAVVCGLYAEWVTDGELDLPWQGVLLPLLALCAYPGGCILLAALRAVGSPRIVVSEQGLAIGPLEWCTIPRERIVSATIVPGRRVTRIRVEYRPRVRRKRASATGAAANRATTGGSTRVVHIGIAPRVATAQVEAVVRGWGVGAAQQATPA